MRLTNYGSAIGIIHTMNKQAMALPKPLRQFYRTIRTNRPHRTKPQATTLALWSDAIIHTGACGLTTVATQRWRTLPEGNRAEGACGLTTVATYAALLLRQPQNTLRQRLRKFYKDAAHKSGAQRRELDIMPCFAALLRWIVRLGTPQHKCLALASDATPLKQRFTVLSVSVLYQHRAIPVAGAILPANQLGSWQPYWDALLYQSSIQSSQIPARAESPHSLPSPPLSRGVRGDSSPVHSRTLAARLV